jgi:hypothetical protein
MFSSAKGVSQFAAIIIRKFVFGLLSVLKEHSAVVVVAGIIASVVRSLHKLRWNLKAQNCNASIAHPGASLSDEENTLRFF